MKLAIYLKYWSGFATGVWWPPEQHSEKKSGHVLHLLCHQVPLGTISDHIFLRPGYHLHHDTTKQDYSCVLKDSTEGWNGALLSSVMRVVSVCIRVMDVHVYGVDLVSVNVWSVFTYDTQAPPQASWCGGPSVTTRGHIWCFCSAMKNITATLHRL